MKNLLLLLLFVFVSVNFSYGQNNLPKYFVGVFQWCPFHCETIKLNSNNTFEFLTKGDMYDGSLKGTWEFIGKNKIRIHAEDKILKEALKNTKETDGIYIDPPYPIEINSVLLLKNKELCSLDEESKIRFCYEKLSNKKAKKLFLEK